MAASTPPGFYGEVQSLVPMLQEYIILVWQDFGKKQQDEIKGVWQLKKQKLLEELAENHKERVSWDPIYKGMLEMPVI